MQDEVTSRRQASVTLAFEVEQLLKQSASSSSSSSAAAAAAAAGLSVEQTRELETLMDEVRHRLSTVSNPPPVTYCPRGSDGL